MTGASTNLFQRKTDIARFANARLWFAVIQSLSSEFCALNPCDVPLMAQQLNQTFTAKIENTTHIYECLFMKLYSIRVQSEIQKAGARGIIH